MNERVGGPVLLRAAAGAGLALVAIAVAWWAVVYAQVIGTTGITAESTLSCLLYTSDRCSLAMALCGKAHFLGIKRYSETVLWVGAAVSALALLLDQRARRGLRG